MTLAAFLGFAALTLMGAISPGPAVLMSARTGLTEGFRVGSFLAMGIGIGACFWAVCAMSGLGLVFAWAPWALTTLKIGGGGFLIWTGIRLWRHARAPLAEGAARATPRSAPSALWLGVMTQLTNPKPVVVMSAIFLGTVPPHTAPWQYGALLAVIFVNETLWNMSVARIFSLDRTRARYISLKTILDRLFGGMLFLFGLKVAAT